MNELAVLRRDHSLELPSEIAAHFQPLDRFIIWRDGDTLLLKRVAPSPLDKAADLPLMMPSPLTKLTKSSMKFAGHVRQNRQLCRASCH